MASMVLLDNRAQIVHQLRSELTIPGDYVLPEGYLLSWQDTFESNQYTVEGIFIVGSAMIRIKNGLHVKTITEVRIESPTIADMEEAIKEVVVFMGGQGGSFCLQTQRHSFVLGLIGDVSTTAKFFRGLYRKILWKLF